MVMRLACLGSLSPTTKSLNRARCHRLRVGIMSRLLLGLEWLIKGLRALTGSGDIVAGLHSRMF